MKLDLTCPNCASCLTTKEDIDFFSILGCIEMCSECKHKFEVQKKHLQTALTSDARQEAIAQKAKIKAMAGKEIPLKQKAPARNKIKTSTEIKNTPPKPQTKSCPYCAEEILQTAIKCKHCGEMLNQREEQEAGEVIEEEKKGMSNENWAVLILLPFILYFCVFNGDNSDSSSKDPIKALFSGWDGSNSEMESMVKSKMKDSSTYEHVETGYRKNDDGTVTIRMKYKGKNSFNATVTGHAVGTIDPDTKTLTKFSMF